MSFNGVSAILLPVHCGKTTLVKELGRQSTKKNVLYVLDLDTYAEVNLPEVVKEVKGLDGTDLDLKLFPEIKKSLQTRITDFPKAKFVLVASNPTIFSYLGVPGKQTFRFSPDSDLFSKILFETVKKDEALAKKMLASWADFVLREDGKSFESWDELQALVLKDVLKVA